LGLLGRYVELVEEFGFDYDSSLMARDVVPYRPRRQVHRESGNVPGKASHVLEIPVNWYLDDFPPLAHVTGIQAGMQDTDTIYRRWRDIFDYGYERVESPCYAVLFNRRSSGRPITRCGSSVWWYYIASREGVWFATCDEIANAWEDDDEDRRLMELEDVRGVENAPVGSGFA
jgi:peptidoglycan-N-acetylglucosamine deacetylase